MRYKAITFIEVEDAYGWSTSMVERDIKDAFSAFGDNAKVVCFAVEEPFGCDVSPVSSRVCERGTRSCDEKHKPIRICSNCGEPDEFDDHWTTLDGPNRQGYECRRKS